MQTIIKESNLKSYILKDEEFDEFEEFLESHYRCHYAQSKEWANVKGDWKNVIIIVRNEDEKIVGSLSLLIRKVPYFKSTLVYAPRGPVCDENNKEVFQKMIEKVDEIAKEHKAFMLKMDPDILSSNEVFKEIAKESGFKICGKIKDATKLINPRFVSRLDLKGKTEEEVFNNFHSKTRYNVRLATKKGVVIEEGKREDIGKFKEIMDVTGDRDGFYIRNKEYFEKIYDSMGPKHVKLMFAKYEGEPISCVMNILFGNKHWYLYGGSLNKYRNLMPNYLLQWEMIKMAIKDGCDIYDFRGNCATDMEHFNEGLYRFKKGFGAEMVEFVEIYKVYNKFMYFIFEHFAYFYRDLKLKIVNMFKKKK